MAHVTWSVLGATLGTFVAIAAGAVALTGGPDAFGYAYRDSATAGGPAFNFVDISGNGTVPPNFPCDDCLGTVGIGFPFLFYGGSQLNVYNQVNVSSNGFLTFSGGQPAGCCTGPALPGPATPNNLVAGLWEDLFPNIGAAKVTYRTLGAAPDRVFVVQFTNVPHFPNGNLTSFQFKLFEGTENIEVHYRNVTTDGGTHSLGLEDAAGQVGLQYRLGSFNLTNTAVRYSFRTPDTAAVLAGTPGDSGWWRSAVTVTLACHPPLGGACEKTFDRVDGATPQPFTLYTAPFAVSPDGPHLIDFYSTSTYNTAERVANATFRVDKTKPVLSLTASCTAPLVNGFCPTAETLTASATDATSGLRLGHPTCTLEGVHVGCGAVLVTASGAHTFVLDAVDVAGNAATAKALFTVDNQPPGVAVTAQCSAPGDGGWCRGPVHVEAKATDAVSGMAPGSPTCTLDGVTVNCAGFEVTPDGAHDLRVVATDRAGNVAKPQVAIRVDATPPIAKLLAPCSLPGNDGWCRTPVTLDAVSGDGTSGVALVECTLDDVVLPCGSTVSAEGESRAALRVRDAAGNEADDEVGLRLDAVPPTASFATYCAKVGTPGWCRAASVAYQAKATDAGSGVASLGCTVDGPAAACTGAVAGEGQHTLVATATDVAGNAGSATKTVGLDSVPPVVGATVGCTVPGNAGWCRGAALFAPAAQDATSGLAGLTCLVDATEVDCAQPYAGDGEHVLRAVARDVAGNTAFTDVPFRIDATPPVVQVAGDCAEPGAAPWCWSRVLVSAPASDATSGVAAVTCTLDGAASPCEVDLHAEGLHAILAKAVDAAGNAAEAAATFGVDFLEPTGAVEAPLLSAGPSSLPWTAADTPAGSGLALVEIEGRPPLGLPDSPWAVVCTTAVSGPTASGTCVQDAPPGVACWRIIVTDVAGHRHLGAVLGLVDFAVSPPRPLPSCGVSP